MSPMSMDRLESAVRAALEMYACLDRGDMAGLKRVLAEDCRIDGPAGEISGRESIISRYEGLSRRFPGMRWEIEEALGAGHRAIVRWRILEPYAQGVDIVRERAGSIVELLRYVKTGNNEQEAEPWNF